MQDIYLENLQISIQENKQKLTLNQLNELYGEDYIPPYFVQNYGGRIYPFSEFWVHKLIELDSYVGVQLERKKKENSGVSQGCSRTWKNKQKRHDKLIASQIFREVKE